MPTPYVGEIILVGFGFTPSGYADCDGQLMPISENETLFQLIGTTYGGDGESTFALPDLRGRIPIGMGATSGSGVTYTIGETGGVEHVTLGVPQLAFHAHTINTNGLTATMRASIGQGNQATPVGNVFAVAATPPFNDATLTPGTSLIRASHITELRSRITTHRASVGLGPFAYTDPTLTIGTTTVKAAHILELRTSLNQAYTQAGLGLPTYTDPALGAGTSIKAVHITELRTALQAVASSPSYSSSAPTTNVHSSAFFTSGSTGNTGGNQPHTNVQPYLVVRYCIALFGIFPSQS